MAPLRARLWSVEGNRQRLDGGAMFGNAPRALWSRWVRPDADHLIPLATRALLVQEDTGRNVLLETGIGAFFPPELRSRYGVEDESHRLLEHLAVIGLAPDDIDVVVLSHLHFDHAGGLLAPWAEGVGPSLVFRRATVVVSAAAWQRARHPHPRDRASFIDGLPDLLDASGRVEVVDGDRSATLGDGYRFHFSDGHTPGLMLTELDAPRRAGGVRGRPRPRPPVAARAHHHGLRPVPRTPGGGEGRPARGRPSTPRPARADPRPRGGDGRPSNGTTAAASARARPGRPSTGWLPRVSVRPRRSAAKEQRA